MIWWARDPDRLKREVGEIGWLQECSPWLSVAAPRLLPDLKFVFDFDIILDGITYPFILEYPAFFPETPPSVIPRDGQRLSNHQYGSGGELCLEFRSDNWDPTTTGAMMMASSHRLLSAERPSAESGPPAPSAHASSVGQQLRGWGCRFLMTRGFIGHTAKMAIGDCLDAVVNDIPGMEKTWPAYVASIGNGDAPAWHEDSIPDQRKQGEPGLVLRVAALPEAPDSMDQARLDRLVVTARGQHLLALTEDSPRPRFTIFTDGSTARMFWSYYRDEAWIVIAYQTIDLVAEPRGRLPASYDVLGQKRVGIVGCGSLGSKIAASLARAGVRQYVLVDDDILKPGNLVRHDLDARNLGAHKAEALADRLKALVPGARVSIRRIALGGQESSATTASALDELAECDLLVDATADPQAFNFIASVAREALRPLVWAEVYAGGIGGFIARVRPGKEPPPHAARNQYLAWCRDHRVAWHGRDRDYATQADGTTAVVADDAEVAVIAAHATRMVVDALVRPDNSSFPYPAYVIGLSSAWIFEEPFDTRPITFIPEDDWQMAARPERTIEAVQFMMSLIAQNDHADRTDS
jgi:hypothetical protein